MPEKRPNINWLDVLWLLFLLGLALIPPVKEVHKQFLLLAFGVTQLLEGWVIAQVPKRGAVYVVLVKIGLAALLINHTGELSINSSYWPIYFLPIVTAAEYFGPWGTLFWTTLTSASYCAYLFEPEIRQYEISVESYWLLAIRVLFFYLSGMLVNRFALEIRRQTQRYQETAATLAETNRRLEQAQAEARRSERLAALGQLSAGLAHEIRNPLGVIKGSAEMLNQKLADSNPLATELAGYISSETNRLSSLVTRFLDFARPLHADLVPREITEVLDRALNDVAQFWKGAAVQVEKHYQPNLPQVPIDEGLCEQAFVNIIQNGYDAMGDKGGRMSVTVSRSRHNTRDGIVEGVEIRIADSGPGIPPELREQMFNPFVTTKKSGVGLGLSIVSKIIDGHHGTIRVEAANPAMQGGTQGPGACFVIFLPAVSTNTPLPENTHLVIS
ncbi:MAG TPA: ATP-binding protein [Candidatus Sulfotelmatobacter sp.]|nr:ATP-binding protein [Candidatus Sulfotelmatobacter sp.]